MLIIVALLLLILVIIWGHFLQGNKSAAKSNENARDETNIQLYHEHKAEIEKDFQQGSLDQDNYNYLLEELDKSLLQDVSSVDNEIDNQPNAIKNMSVFWPISLSLFVLAFSFVLYSYTGAYKQLTEPQVNNTKASHQSAQVDQARVKALQDLKTLTEQEPENANAWYNLGNAFVAMGEYEKSIQAFDMVMSIEGEKADILGAQAQALYYLNGQTISPEVQVLMDKSLALDPYDASTNILLGMHNFMGQSYQKAIDYWQLVVEHNPQTVNVEAINQAISEAKSRLALTGEKPTVATASPEDTTSPQLHLNIQLSDEILAQLSQGDDKVVFVYAVPATGSRMPVAALKIKASDLPTEVVLNNSRAMSPQANLSSVSEVHLYAVVSNQGGVGIKSGDFKAEILNVDVNTTKVLILTIDTIVP